MTLEVNQIKASSEAAIASNPEKPNFSEVYKSLSNNTTAQEQKEERTAANEVVHKKFPDLDLIGQDKVKNAQGQDQEALIVFDKKTSHVQMRSTQDFSVLSEKDMSAEIKSQNASPEQASEVLASAIDRGIEMQAQGRATGEMAGEAGATAESVPDATKTPDAAVPPETTRKLENPQVTAEETAESKKAPDQVKVAGETALANNPEKPDFSEIFKALSNNTTPEQQKEERTAFNEVLHTKYPDLDLVGHNKLSTPEGKTQDALIVFDKKNNHLQARSVNDFSVLVDNDISDKVKAQNLTPEQASQALASDYDQQIAQVQGPKSNSPEANGDKAVVPPAEKPIESIAKDKSSEKAYVVKEGDCLWNIAKGHLKETDPEAKDPSNLSIRNYVDKIVARNSKYIKDEDLIYPGQKFILPELKNDSDAKKTAQTKAETEVQPQVKPGETNNKPGDVTTNPGDKPIPPVVERKEEPSTPDLFNEDRNAIPPQESNIEVKPNSASPENDF